MERIIKINGQVVDVDKQTALGITLQSYDISEPAQAKVNVSNSFTLPLTDKNRSIFGFGDSPYNLTDFTIYEEISFDYWVGNEQLVSNARARVTSIQERITLFIFEKGNIWDRLKQTKIIDLINDFFNFVIDEKDFFNFQGTLKDLLLYFSGNDPDVVPYKFSRCNSLLSFYNPIGTETPLEDYSNLWLFYDDENDLQVSPIAGGHIFVFCKSLFEFFEYKFGVSFSTNENFAANIFQDEFAKQSYTNVFPQLTLFYDDSGTDEENGWRMNFDGSFESYLSDGTILQSFGNIETPLADYTCYDFVAAFIKTFNCIVDSVEPNVFKLRRFDQLESDAEIVDFSKNITGVPKWSPEISGIAQENKIRFSSIYNDGSDDANGRTIQCNNLNIDASNDEFVSINFHIPVINIKDSDDSFVNLGSEEALQTPSIMVDGAQNISAFSVSFKDVYQGIVTASFLGSEVPTAQLVGLTDEYQLYETVIDKPFIVEIRKWLTISDITDLEFFKLYSIPVLGGSFFINKITGFNTESQQATLISLIKITDKIALPPDGLTKGVWALDKNTGWRADSDSIMIYEREGKYYNGVYDHDGLITY